jgi:hypothetical protein
MWGGGQDEGALEIDAGEKQRRKWLSNKVYNFKVHNNLTKFTFHTLYNNIIYASHTVE